jgi:hypothetical protein
VFAEREKELDMLAGINERVEPEVGGLVNLRHPLMRRHEQLVSLVEIHVEGKGVGRVAAQFGRHQQR